MSDRIEPPRPLINRPVRNVLLVLACVAVGSLASVLAAATGMFWLNLGVSLAGGWAIGWWWGDLVDWVNRKWEADHAG